MNSIYSLERSMRVVQLFQNHVFDNLKWFLKNWFTSYTSSTFAWESSFHQLSVTTSAIPKTQWKPGLFMVASPTIRRHFPSDQPGSPYRNTQWSWSYLQTFSVRFLTGSLTASLPLKSWMVGRQALTYLPFGFWELFRGELLNFWGSRVEM